MPYMIVSERKIYMYILVNLWILIFEPQRMMRIIKKGCFCVLLFVLYAASFGVAATKCSSTNSCPGTQHCCRRNNVCRSNCVNEPCSSLSQCATENIAVTANVLQIAPHLPTMATACREKSAVVLRASEKT